MSYHPSIKEAAKSLGGLTSADHCFECGEAIVSASVSYAGYADGGTIESIYLHPACAALMGQRLITDGFPNRRKG